MNSTIPNDLVIYPRDKGYFVGCCGTLRNFGCVVPIADIDTLYELANIPYHAKVGTMEQYLGITNALEKLVFNFWQKSRLADIAGCELAIKKTKDNELADS